jgi:hypothetical protein
MMPAWLASDDGLTFPGDPTFLGWLTVVCYGLAAGLCLNAARAAGRRQSIATGSREALFWRAMTILLTALGVNKQLDLQILVIIVGKWLAQAQGWYEHRRIVQVACTVCVAAAASASVIVVAWLTRRVWRDFGLALIGLALLAGFVILRVAYFERMDDLVGIPLRASRAKWVLEIGGIVCIGLSAWRHGRSIPRRD